MSRIWRNGTYSTGPRTTSGRYHVQEVEQAPDKETYLYYSTQRPIDIGTYPNSYFNRPVHMDLYFTRSK